MKTNLVATSLALFTLFLGITSSYPQNFINLGFESAQIPLLNPPDQTANLSLSNALPGWTGSLGANPASQVLYNGLSAGSVEIALIGRNTDFFSNSIIAGQFTVVLQSGTTVESSTPVSSSIAQTSLVPVGSLSLEFAAVEDHNALVVTFNGQNIPIIPLSAGPNYEEYGADISQYAGQVGELQFTAEPTIATSFENVYLDSIMFSTSPVPEPRTVALLATGAGAVLLGLRRTRKSLP